MTSSCLINNGYESLIDALLYVNRIRTFDILPSENFKPTLINSPLKTDIDIQLSFVFQELFSQLQFSRERALPADEVRRALAAPFCGQRRFRLGCMADAAECFENILLRLHAHVAHPQHDHPEDACRAPHCVPHRKFSMALVEQSVCAACGATSEPLPFTQVMDSFMTDFYVWLSNIDEENSLTFLGNFVHSAFYVCGV